MRSLSETFHHTHLRPVKLVPGYVVSIQEAVCLNGQPIVNVQNLVSPDL